MLQMFLMKLVYIKCISATDLNGDVYFCLTDVADVLEISRSSDLLQVQKDFVFKETPKNRGALDPKGVTKNVYPYKWRYFKV